MMNLYGSLSWEEQAFAEDIAGTLSVWPPRSYSCSFCGREFKSAQALGGHMNVHRRDRARLKQSPIRDQPEVITPGHPSQMCNFIHKNPNSEFSDDSEKLASNVIRVSSEDEKNMPSRLCFVPPLVSHRYQIFNSIRNEAENRSANSTTDEKEDCFAQDYLSVSLSLVMCPKQRKTLSYEEEVGGCKRRRADRLAKTPLNFLPAMKEGSSRLCHRAAEEALDLELRLGDAPKVK